MVEDKAEPCLVRALFFSFLSTSSDSASISSVSLYSSSCSPKVALNEEVAPAPISEKFSFYFEFKYNQ